MDKEKLKYYRDITILTLSSLILSYIVLTRFLGIAIPFFFSWGVVFCVRPIAEKIARFLKISDKWIRLLLTLIVIFAILSAILGVLIFACREAVNFVSGLSEGDKIYTVISKILNPLSGFFKESEEGVLIEEKISEAVRELLSSFLGGFVNLVSNFVRAVPGILIFLITTLISAVYFSLDFDNISSKIKESLPEKMAEKLINYKNRFLLTAFSYLRSYLVIMVFVFFMLLIGFLIIGVRYAILLALIFAVLDMLPVLGIGILMLPWGVFEMLFGSFSFGVGIICVFLVTEVVRNLIEPKIVGKNLGIHPILTLILIYATYTLFGIFGLLLMPFFSVILNLVFDKNNSSEIPKG